MIPNFKEEKALWRKGFRFVACVDEVGRGPLAGPVVAVAVVIRQMRNDKFQNLKDSKQLTPKAREKFYKILTANNQICWGTGRVYPRVIDRINIFQATKLAMLRALKNLEQKLAKIDFVILDGRMKLDIPIPQKSIIKGDEKVFSCAVASIIAKVQRDRLMRNYHKKFPQYGFHQHKGYGTKLHMEMLKKFGLCKIHRKSFTPLADF